MVRYKVIVSYAGENYVGWQSQRKGKSIQQVIEKVIAKIADRETLIVAAGRTDAKVNAVGQTFHFDSDLIMDEYKWVSAVNGYLPDDIRVIDVEEVSDLFHARYNVLYKQYDYFINLGEYNVFTRNYVLNHHYKLDVEKMKEASKCLIGYHDFTSYCANSLSTHPNQWREIFKIDFSIKEDILKISFKGKGFLRYMVRMMVGTLIEVGRGKLGVDKVKEFLELRDKEVVKKNAPPSGLTLHEVAYFRMIYLDDNIMVRSVHKEDLRLLDDEKLDFDNLYGVCLRNKEGILSLYKYKEGNLELFRGDFLLSEEIKSKAVNHLEKSLF